MVKKIFKLAMDGIGIFKIAGILTAEQIERPSYYLGTRGRGRRKNTYDPDFPHTWCSASVASILNKPEYAGHLVNLRTTSTDFKKGKQKKNPKEEWLIFPNAHEAIVDQETFDIVQKLRETPRRMDTIGEANPLTGLLWCADFNAKMYNHRKAKPSTPNQKKLLDVYHCSTYKLGVTRHTTSCTSHHISSEAANEIILDAIRKICGYVKEHEALFIEQLRESTAIKQGETAKAHKKQITKNGRRLIEIDRIYKSLYEDKALGKIDESIFEQMASCYQQERDELAVKIKAMQSELDAFNEDSTRADKFLEIVQRYTNFETLTPAMLKVIH